MSRLRLAPYKQLSKVAEAAGFEWVRRKGSHNTFRNAEGRIVVLPDHGSQVIVRDLGLTVDEYHRILDEL